MKNKEVKQKIDSLNNQYEYVYSPAYLEEVANIRDNEEQIKTHIQKMRELFYDREYLPTKDRGIIKTRENPWDCFERVNSWMALTKMAEKLNLGFFSHQPLFDTIRENAGIQTIEINNIEPEVFFQNDKIRSILEPFPEYSDFYLNDDRSSLWNSINGNFTFIQRNVSKLFDLLEAIGYYPEKEKTYTSRMHDVTHAIYATQADYFVTCDTKFYKKCKAVYSFLGVPTSVIKYSSFG